MTWVLPPESPAAAVLNRPAGIAFSADGAAAYVTSFITPDAGADAPAEGEEADGVRGTGAAPPGASRHVLAFWGPASAAPWTPLPGFDSSAAPAAGIYPWGAAWRRCGGADGGSTLIVTAHGGRHDGAQMDCVAELCARTGVVLRIWRHEAMRGGHLHSLALL